VKRPATNLDRYNDYLEAQVKELITGYGPLLEIWFDVPQYFDRACGERVIRFVRALQPDILVNNRTGAPGDFDTPENTVGHFQIDRPWETDATLNHQWAWKPNDTIRSLQECLHMLVVCASGDGNFVLNTGPMPDGRIEPQQVVRFRQIGDWLKKYGESTYGTRGGPLRSPDEHKRSQNGYYDRFTIAGDRYWGGSTHKRQYRLPAHPPVAERQHHAAGHPAQDCHNQRAHRRRSDRETDQYRHRSHRASRPARSHGHDRET
jgi:hypothetical protein